MAFVGLFMLICGTMKSEFVVYRMLVGKSKSLWGENVHRCYQCAGFAVFIVGALVALKIIGR